MLCSKSVYKISVWFTFTIFITFWLFIIAVFLCPLLTWHGFPFQIDLSFQASQSCRHLDLLFLSHLTLFCLLASVNFLELNSFELVDDWHLRSCLLRWRSFCHRNSSHSWRPRRSPWPTSCWSRWPCSSRRWARWTPRSSWWGGRRPPNTRTTYHRLGGQLVFSLS